MQTLRDLQAEVAWEMCWNSLSLSAWAFLSPADFTHMPHHASLLQSFSLLPQQSRVLQPICSKEVPFLGELYITWQEKFLGNEWSLTICGAAQGLEVSFPVTEGSW